MSKTQSKKKNKKDKRSKNQSAETAKATDKQPKQIKRSRLKNAFSAIGHFLISRRLRQVVITFLILIIAAIFLTWLLEYRHYIDDWDRVFEVISTRPAVFFYNALVMFCVLLFFYGIFQKPFIAIATNAAIVVAIGYIHISKFNFRGAPLLPEDFQLGSQAGTLIKFVDVWEIVRLVIAIILIIVLGKILDRVTKNWLRKTSEKTDPWWKRYRLISRVVIITIAIAGFLATTDFARYHKYEDPRLEFLDSEFTDWNQVQNYDDNGFLIGFIYNIGSLNIATPDDYTESKINEIRKELAESRALQESDKTALSELDTNIIIVLNESFFDPENIREYYNYDGGDVTPNLHKIEGEELSGKMFSPDYGGGTANIEYEVLTGLTNYFTKTVPYTNLLPYQETVPSVASFARENGLGAIAIHPFNGGIYKRENVLPKMGFEEFITEQEFEFDEKDGESEYINDRSAYNQALKVIEESNKPMLISLITMQNHAPYNFEEYGESEFKVTNIEDGGEKNAVETYLMTVHLSDQYLGEFYEKVKALDEKTVVLFFGDHSPGVFPQVIESRDNAVSQTARQTPYLLFANFEMKNAPVLTRNVTALQNWYSKAYYEKLLAEQRKTLALPTTTPNCLVNTMFNILGSTKPLHFYLLDEVCASEPILTDAYFDGEMPSMSLALSSYELLTYDLAAGKQYFLNK